jgi:ATP-dependent HslUV protease subunit HslV
MQKPMKSTTILCVRHGGKTVIVSDGQVTLGDTVFKSNVQKVRTICEDSNKKPTVVAGFAGAVADALILIEMLEKKVQDSSGELELACLDMAKAWRQNKLYRGLHAEIIVADKDSTFLIAGGGDILRCGDIAATGSGGLFAKIAGETYVDALGDKITAKEVAEKAMEKAAETCIYTNNNFTFIEL